MARKLWRRAMVLLLNNLLLRLGREVLSSDKGEGGTGERRRDGKQNDTMEEGGAIATTGRCRVGTV